MYYALALSKWHVRDISSFICTVKATHRRLQLNLTPAYVRWLSFLEPNKPSQFEMAVFHSSNLLNSGQDHRLPLTKPRCRVQAVVLLFAIPIFAVSIEASSLALPWTCACTDKSRGSIDASVWRGLLQSGFFSSWQLCWLLKEKPARAGWAQTLRGAMVVLLLHVWTSSECGCWRFRGIVLGP